ncbi:MAG: homocysteine S-methyltransferase family protein [Candidatus Didemnitutus sp.]|nr:homocysteine S-methyltransferase family protein [Candidatus Didemnitutus sp.]
MSTLTQRQSTAAAELRHLFAQRIAILDGAMGTMLQQHQLTEADFRGPRFAAHPHDLKGNNDLLCLTRPEIVEAVHYAYFEAGADMVETNTFNANRISQADYAMESVVTELNAAAAELALRAAHRAEEKYRRRCFVAGALGPLNRTLSLSPDVNRPDFRAVNWDEVVAAYYEQARALVAGGVDVLLIETIFDTLNCKAALFALSKLWEEVGAHLPVFISVTITDQSGRTLSGQTTEAFYNSIRHAHPFCVGINCALGGAQMRPFVEELARHAECPVSCYPNAGLPNAMGGYDETPEQTAAVLGEFASEGWLNLVGGCCGTTPAHIAAIAKELRKHNPRPLPVPAESNPLRLSGLEPLTIA